MHVCGEYAIHGLARFFLKYLYIDKVLRDKTARGKPFDRNVTLASGESFDVVYSFHPACAKTG